MLARIFVFLPTPRTPPLFLVSWSIANRPPLITVGTAKMMEFFYRALASFLICQYHDTFCISYHYHMDRDRFYQLPHLS